METLTKIIENFYQPKSKLLAWLPPLLWMAVIFTLSSIPTLHASPVMFQDFVIKKTAHVTEYAILFTLLFRATKRNYVVAFVVTVLYAASDELHQRFVIGRGSSIFDVGFDTVGASIASYCLWKLEQTLRKKPKN